MKGRDEPLLDPESPAEPPEVTRDSPFTGGDGRPSEPEPWVEMGRGLRGDEVGLLSILL